VVTLGKRMGVVLGVCAAPSVFWLMLPRAVPTYSNPSFLALLVDNRWFLAASRCVLVTGGAYIAVSVVALTLKRQWLRGFGPFSTPFAEVTEDLDTVTFERDGMKVALVEALRLLNDLRENGVASDLGREHPADDTIGGEG
jgi:hypothetical protein